MIIEKTYRNDDNLFRVLIKKDDTYYLIEEFIISGTFYHNYCLYSDTLNNKDILLDEDSDKYELGTFRDLEECFEYLEKIA